MNFLVMVGNFMGDWVRGSLQSLELRYPPEIVKGITMHRFIDSFTDANPITNKSIKKMRPLYGKYAGVVVDVLYDYFLAKNWMLYCSQDLQQYCSKFYDYCIEYYDYLPQKLQMQVPHLIISNRLASYARLEGISAALKTMEFTTSLPKHTDCAVEVFVDNYHDFQEEFTEFFDKICDAVEKKFDVVL